MIDKNAFTWKRKKEYNLNIYEIQIKRNLSILIYKTYNYVSYPKNKFKGHVNVNINVTQI